MNDLADIPKASTTARFPLEPASPAELGLHEPALARLRELIERHIADGRYPGAQIALARHGRLALFESFGRTSISPAAAANADTLWLLFSNTKVITAAGIWALVADGALRFADRIADHIPEFARHGKADITLAQVLSHRAGFPSQAVSSERLDRPRRDAPPGLRLHARMDAGLAPALSPQVRILDRGHF